MTEINYDEVTADQLEIFREPRKSVVKVRHLPTGTVAEEAVTPQAHAPARFRRPTNLPKENRVPDMVGYIEGQSDDDKGFWIITEGENAKNEYLEALVADKEALRISFEGAPKSSSSGGEAERQPVPGTEQAAETPEPPPAAEVPPPSAEPVAEPTAVATGDVAPEAPQEEPAEPVAPPAPDPEPAPPTGENGAGEEAVDPADMEGIDELLAGLEE